MEIRTCKLHYEYLRKEDILLDELELYYDHYKETCSLSKEEQARRNKNYVIVLLIKFQNV